MLFQSYSSLQHIQVLTICRRVLLFGTNQSSIDGDETTLCGDDLSRSALRHLADVRGALSNELWMDILTRHPVVVRGVRARSARISIMPLTTICTLLSEGA